MSPSTPRETRTPRRFASLPALCAAAGLGLAQVALTTAAAADEPAPAPAPTTPSSATVADEPPAAAPPEPTARPAGELLPWSGTLLRWGHAVSASTLGVQTAETPFAGFDGATVSDDDWYTQSFVLSGGYFILRRPPHQLRVSTSIAVDVELTDSDTTTYKHQPDLRDIPLRLTYTPTLWSKGEGGPIKGDAAMYDPTLLGTGGYRTWGLVSGAISFPTSRGSQGSGLLLGTSLAIGVRQQLDLLGSDAPGLTHIVLAVSETWSHFFYRATTPVNSAVEIPRLGTNGTPLSSDQLSGIRNVENQLSTTFSLVLPLYQGLQLGSSFRIHHSFKYGASGANDCIQLTTGCVDIGPEASPAVIASSSFGVDLSYLIIPELAVDLGYSNTASTVSPNGTTRNPFVSPNALFYAGATFSFDRVYPRFADPAGLRAMLGEPPPPSAP